MKFTQMLAALTVATSAAVAAPIAEKRDGAALFGGSTLTAYWGQGSSTHELKDLCSDGSFDVIILSFLSSLNPPALSFGAHGGPASAAQNGMKWGNLLDGTVAPQGSTSIADQITACQAAGKKVMVSFGGDKQHSSVSFASDDEANNAATLLWNLLLGGNDEKVAPANTRPFGKVVLDGVDLDNESLNGAHYEAFVGKLRDLSVGSKEMYISAAPEATANTKPTGIPDDVYPRLDFVNVQFYNGGPGTGILGQSNFLQQVTAWNDHIKQLSPNTKLMIGSPTSKNSAGSGVLGSSGLVSAIKSVQSAKLSQFGGVTLFTGGDAMDTGNMQKDVKGAL